ncbi:MAG: DUF3592 domain-containing protein [Alphaproteobacteria bacterium]|nr:DUF3592 domain-containing protein [Alphaproteobacteria bacterium]
MRFAGVIFLLVGFALGFLTWYLYADTRTFLETAVTAQGEVVSFDRRFDATSRNRDRGDTYYPVLAFTASNGTKVRFTANQGSNPPAYQVGEHVEVLYDAINPQNARMGGFAGLWLGIIASGVMAVIFAGVGAFTILKGIRRAADRNWLLSSGQIVQADIVRVEYEQAEESGGQGGWHILAQWQDPRTRKVHVMRSDPIPFDPTPYLPAGHVPVRINPLNPEKYWVDTSFLPEAA